MNNKPLPKTAIRILGRPGIESLERPGEGIRDIYWSCWASKGWSAFNGSDGIRKTSLGSIESWAKDLRGPTDPGRVPAVAEAVAKHIETGVITGLDLRSLRSYIERHMPEYTGNLACSTLEFQTIIGMDSIDGYELDKSLAKRYKISAERFDAFYLAIAIADEATGSNQHRNLLRKHQRWERKREAEIEALLAEGEAEDEALLASEVTT